MIKLNFRDICEIDGVDGSYHDIQELSLNHNHLRSLDGVEQFRNLRSLHLNFNQLRSKDELRKLANPALLQELSFKGNPNLEFATKEDSIEWALDVFPNLQYLNGHHIDDGAVLSLHSRKQHSNPAPPSKKEAPKQPYRGGAADTLMSNANQTQLLSTGTLDFSIGSRQSNFRSKRGGSQRNDADSLQSPPVRSANVKKAPAREVIQQFSHQHEQDEEESELDHHDEEAMLSMTHMTSKTTETHQDFMQKKPLMR